ncbi:EF-hand and coiled-coil domain-containing protein 1 isoform X2 [Silurus meridionalis]|uniref:EF-hand and coiled-coil domain-containing protein 1 isoform X2 n=1 Tax=Silurus meridionalis TaxID=175797 RepID=UPI001EEBB3EE|nr:EF-hand and coiled-coil domain-containing protein 1 isoform X2 [Silurus meridionalis]
MQTWSTTGFSVNFARGFHKAHAAQMYRACAPPQPFRAARKTEWLCGALAHHFGCETGAENEIVVLATGIDQYLQEIFHHLAYASSGDLVSGQDFRLLCAVLGVSAGEDGAERDLCASLPPALGFREFHSRLCGFFAARACDAPSSVRLLISEETEHVERDIRVRWPRVRRRKCVSFDLTRDRGADRTARGRMDTGNVCAPDPSEPGRKAQQRSWQEQVEMENAGLRELVEDLRSALQSSDARCMCLEVALRKERLHAPDKSSPQTTERQISLAGCEPKLGQSNQNRRTKDLIRELELIRASRDGQLEEAMRFNRRLEEELISAYVEVSRLEELVSKLRRESAEIKRRAEEARAALAAGLARVKDIQDWAQKVKPLQDKVQNLETELERFRSQCTCMAQHQKGPGPPVESVEPTARVIPTGRDSQDETLIRGEEALQRAVEGRASSDEEEEVRVKDEGQCCLLEVKRLLNKLHNCAKGCQKMALCHLLLSQNSSGLYNNQIGFTGPSEAKTRGLRNHMLLDGNKTDRRISRKTLSKILLKTLDLCNVKGQESIPIFQVMDALCQQLISSDLVCVDGDVTTWRGVNPHHQNTTNPLLIFY